MFPWQSCREVRAHGMGRDSRSEEVTGEGERLAGDSLVEEKEELEIQK